MTDTTISFEDAMTARDAARAEMASLKARYGVRGGIRGCLGLHLTEEQREELRAAQTRVEATERALLASK